MVEIIFICPSVAEGCTRWLAASNSFVLTAFAPRVSMTLRCLYFFGKFVMLVTLINTSNLSACCFLLRMGNMGGAAGDDPRVTVSLPASTQKNQIEASSQKQKSEPSSQAN